MCAKELVAHSDSTDGEHRSHELSKITNQRREAAQSLYQWRLSEEIPVRPGARSAEKSDPSFKDAMELYENGKQRRYGLLFSVNGGAFAILTFLVRDVQGVARGGRFLIVWSVSLGLAAITVVLAYDIFRFGVAMRELFAEQHLRPEPFEKPGKAVVALLAILLAILRLATAAALTVQ